MYKDVSPDSEKKQCLVVVLFTSTWLASVEEVIYLWLVGLMMERFA